MSYIIILFSNNDFFNFCDSVFLQVMNEMCGNKPWVEPLAETGSNVEIKISEAETENETKKQVNKFFIINCFLYNYINYFSIFFILYVILFFIDSKKRLNQIFEEYANNSLNEKRLRREAAEKRHEEKMHILSQIENFLEKMVNNKKG